MNILKENENLKKFKLVIKKHNYQDGFLLISKSKERLYQVKLLINGEGSTRNFKTIKEAINEYYDTIRFVNMVLNNNH